MLDHMRTFVDLGTIDGEYGIARAYEKRYLSLQDLREAYTRYLNLKDLVYRFAPESN